MREHTYKRLSSTALPPTGSGITTGYTVLNQTAAQGNLSAFVNPEDIEFGYPDTGNNWAEARCGVRPHQAKPSLPI